MELTHIDESGNARMVDVSGKPRVKRTAVAEGRISLKKETIEMLKHGFLKKGYALATAKIATIAGAKKTSDLIPLCHNIAIDNIDVAFNILEDCIEIQGTAICTDKTGIEMEALTAVSIAALTIYDMCKAKDKEMEIGQIRLIKKTKEDIKWDCFAIAGEVFKIKTFEILSINISEKKGEQKKPIEKAVLKESHGIVSDAHARDWHRQVSLLAQEDIDTMMGKGVDLKPGDFAENITTHGIDLSSLAVGTRFRIGDCELEVTQIGKTCHHDCAIYQQIGECVMPRKGIFAKVIKGGEICCKSQGFLD